MLETEEVDDDYFTPIASTSLANIFGNKDGQETENSSLKYVPQPQIQDTVVKSDDIKVTQCILACALYAYEWNHKVYSEKGKIGFAIMKNNKTGTHNIILYDSCKRTLSCTTVSQKLEIIMKGKTYLSYFDDLAKYWSLYSTEDEISKIVEILESLNAKIKFLPYTEESPPKPDNVEINNHSDKECFESDTDSSKQNRVSKASILSRMASMGHAILPSKSIPTEKFSDSSDTNETVDSPHQLRHKPIKCIVKRSNQEKYLPTVQNTLLHNHLRGTVPDTDHSKEGVSLFTYVDGKLMPANTNIVLDKSNSNLGNDNMNLFMSEQRVHNSEIRINMGRISDKVDHIIDKIRSIESTDNTKTSIQEEITQKLLSEYEQKIKMYEEMLKYKDSKISTSNLSVAESSNLHCNDTSLKLETSMKKKGEEISTLKQEINLLKHEIEKKNGNILDLRKEISDLKSDMASKTEVLLSVTEKYEALLNHHDSNAVIAYKTKAVMNDTYHAISANFNAEESYSGETIKTIIAKVIKQVTISSLNEK